MDKTKFTLGKISFSVFLQPTVSTYFKTNFGYFPISNDEYFTSLNQPNNITRSDLGILIK
jgi:hypothetical protein